MNISKLAVISTGSQFCFAETIEGRPENIFVAHNYARNVLWAGTTKTCFAITRPQQPYFLNIGDVIVAEIGDGNEKRKMAVAWAPENIWEGTYETKTRFVQPAAIAVAKVRKPAVDFIGANKTEIRRLDPNKDGNVVIRVLDQNNHQVDRGYGSLSKLMDRDHKDIELFLAFGNKVEALIDKRWVPVKNPFIVVTIPKIAA